MSITDERRAEAQSILSEYGFSLDEIIELTEPLKMMRSRALTQTRHAKWIEAYVEDSHTVQQIAAFDSVSDEAVRIVLRKAGVWKGRPPGKPKVVGEPRDPMQIYGVPMDVVKEYHEFRKPYLTQRSYVKTKVDVPWALTLVEWAKIWATSGHYKERGNKRHNYCMTRTDTTKGFTTDNVEIVTILDAQERGRERN